MAAETLETISITTPGSRKVAVALAVERFANTRAAKLTKKLSLMRQALVCGKDDFFHLGNGVAARGCRG